MVRHCLDQRSVLGLHLVPELIRRCGVACLQCGSQLAQSRAVGRSVWGRRRCRLGVCRWASCQANEQCSQQGEFGHSAQTSRVVQLPSLSIREMVSRRGDMETARALRPQLKVLTSLRFFAAALVVLFHVQVSGTLVAGPWWYRNFAGIGFIGVNCFFVLSGFILVYTYAGKPISARRFWQARFARVYPAYLFSLLVTAPLFFYVMRVLHLPLFAWSERHLTAAMLLTVGLLQAWVPQAALTWNPVCWSLSAEAFFYLVFPGLLLWGARLNTRGL